VPFRVVAVLGLAEGEFPATLREDPLLRDADRLGLRARGLPLDLSTQSAEMGFFYEALCRPRERLLLTRPCLAEGGVPWEASPYWDEVLLATGAQPLRLTSDTPVALPQAASLPEAFESLAQLPEESPWHAWMRAREPERYARWQRTMAIQQERWTRAPRGPHNGDLQTLAGALKERYGPEHCWSASALETYRDCPHWFFVGRTLGLEARQDPEEGLDSRQLGSIYHRLLQATYETCARDDRADAESLVAALESVAQGILDAAPAREGFRETAWWEQTRREIHQTVAATLRALAVATAGHMPEAFELWFDVRVGDPTTGELRLHGIIDRLDRMADGGWCVIDYKTGGATRYAQAAAQEGRVLQLPLYALAAQALQGGEVREGYYWHIRDAQASGLRLRADPGPEQAMADALRYGLEAVGGVRAGAFLPRPPRDGCPDYCPAAAWCVRYRPAAKGQSR
jgi:ATP-dependent helicase/DNAse subunit B